MFLFYLLCFMIGKEPGSILKGLSANWQDREIFNTRWLREGDIKSLYGRLKEG